MKRLLATLSLLAMLAPTLSFFISAEPQQPPLETTEDAITINAEVTQSPLLTAVEPTAEVMVEATETVAEETEAVTEETEAETTPEPETTAEETTEPETSTPETQDPVRTVMSIETREPIDVPETFKPFTSFLYNDIRCPLHFSEELQYHTYLMSEKYGVPYRIIMGIMGVETGWTADIGVTEGGGGEKYVGLGCLNERYNAETFAKRDIDIYTPEGNIEAICWIIRDNLAIFDNNIDLAMMAYNGGVGYAKNKIAQGITETTYTQRVHYFADSLE